MRQYELPIPQGKILLLGGGVRSGKSAFALDLARQLGKNRAFIATATALDEEMKSRIERHQRERRDEFTTIEEPIDLAAALDALSGYDVAVVDCLTLWLSNLLLNQESVDAILAQVMATQTHDTIDRLDRISAPTLVLTGDNDLLIPCSNSDRLAAAISGSTLKKIPGGSHGFNFETPDVFNRAILDFLATVKN